MRVGWLILVAVFGCDSPIFVVAEAPDTGAADGGAPDAAEPRECAQFEVTEIPEMVGVRPRGSAIQGDDVLILSLTEGHSITATSVEPIPVLSFQWIGYTLFRQNQDTFWVTGANTNRTAKLIRRIELSSSRVETTTVGALIVALAGPQDGEAPFELFAVVHMNDTGAAMRYDGARWRVIRHSEAQEPRNQPSLVWVGPSEAYFTPGRGGCRGVSCIIRYTNGSTTAEGLQTAAPVSALANVPGVGLLAGTTAGRILIRKPGGFTPWVELGDSPLLNSTVRAIIPFEDGFLYFAGARVAQYNRGWCDPLRLGDALEYVTQAQPQGSGVIIAGEARENRSSTLRLRRKD